MMEAVLFTLTFFGIVFVAPAVVRVLADVVIGHYGKGGGV